MLQAATKNVRCVDKNVKLKLASTTDIKDIEKWLSSVNIILYSISIFPKLNEL